MRQWLSAVVCLGMAGTALAQAPAPAPTSPPAAPAPAAKSLAIAGQCYALKLPRGQDRLITRIELQQVQVQAKDGSITEPPRVHIGMQPKGGDDLIPSEVSAPCSGTGGRLACVLRCDGAAEADTKGRFRIEPAGKDSLKLTIETPLTLNACTPGETPVTLPKALAGKSFVLKRAGSSECFH